MTEASRAPAAATAAGGADDQQRGNPGALAGVPEGARVGNFGANVGSSTFEHYDVPSPAPDPSPDFYLPWYPSKRHFLRRTLLALACLIALAGLAFGIASFIEQPVRHQLRGSVEIIAGIALAVIIYGLGMYFTVGDKDAEVEEFRQGGDPRLGRRPKSDDDVDERTTNQRLLSQYHDLTKDQAASSYRVSQVAMVVGFTILASGGFLVVRQAQSTSAQIVVGGLSALGAAFASYIGATFVRTYNQALSQMNFYYAQPLVQSYILEAERISTRLSNPTKKDAVLGQIIAQTLKGADVAAQLTRPADGPGRPTRRQQGSPAPAGGVPTSDDPAPKPTGRERVRSGQ